jgi:hypothetical protein
MAKPEQPARTSARIGFHEERTGREVSMESVDFAHRRDKRRRKNALAKAARRKNRS